MNKLELSIFPKILFNLSFDFSLKFGLIFPKFKEHVANGKIFAEFSSVISAS